MANNLRGKIKDLKRLQSGLAGRILRTFPKDEMVVWEGDDGKRYLGKVVRHPKWSTVEINTGKRLIAVDLSKGHLTIFTGEF